MGDDRNKRFHESTAKCLVDTACCVELTVNLPDMSELLLINITGLDKPGAEGTQCNSVED